jgi:hypothetical protein
VYSINDWGEKSMKNESHYFQKAAHYNLLADYYKYMDPMQHIQYYQKHIQYFRKAMNLNREFVQVKPTYIRFMNATKDHPSVDIYTNGRLLIRNLTFEGISPFYTLPVGKYHIDIYPSGTQVSTIINKNLTFEPNQSYTLATVGTNDKLQLMSYLDQPHVTSPVAKIRFVHLSSQSPSVDVTIKHGKTLFENIRYKKSSEYKSIEPMTTDLQLIETGTKKVIKTIENITFAPTGSFSIFFIDSNIIMV